MLLYNAPRKGKNSDTNAHNKVLLLLFQAKKEEEEEEEKDDQKEKDDGQQEFNLKKASKIHGRLRRLQLLVFLLFLVE